MPSTEGSFKVWIYLGFIVGLTRSSRPRFDTSTDMRKVLIPPDADVDSVIFRLRATDEEPDFPLIFNVTATVIPVVRIENLPCTLYNKVCQANVILTRRLSPGKFYDFLVVVRDSKGENNSMQATISVTNGTTPRSKIFLHKPSLIMVPEDAKPGTELDYMIVQSNPWSNKPVYIELWQPKDLFKIIQRQTERQTQGIITLIGELDFETQSMHTLTMYATDPYTELNYDTRNIVGLQIVVIVQDVQDVPPIFTLAPPLTKINNTIQPGDVILRVHAEDGDKGVPREVTYGLVSEYNPFTTYFNINESSGEISLSRPLEELAQITRVGTPILLSVVAEEIRHSWDEPPAQATVVEIGILLGEPKNSPPYFESDNYLSCIEENADLGTTLQFTDPNTTKVKDDDIGKAGVFTLKLVDNNGTFEIAPSVAERAANFVITVRDNMLLDYEVHKSLSFKIFAQEVGPMTNLSASTLVTVFLKDVNDNPPEFDQPAYEVTLSENVTVGNKVVQVLATDKDTGIFAKIRYTGISGPGSEAFSINSNTGWITVTAKTDALDREKAEKLELFVEARDEDGKGLQSMVKLIVHLLDVNDNAPIFEKNLYEFQLNSEMTNFTAPAFVKAIDADAESPNNEVRYEILHGNYENKFQLNEITGELFVREQIRKARHAEEPKVGGLILELRKDHRFSAAMLSSDRKHFIMTESSFKNLKKDESNSKINSTPQIRVKRADEDPSFTLTVRAYDLGVPLMSSVVQVHILHGIAPGARIVTFVMPGEQLDPNKAAETLATITGSRVTIQEIRPYDEDQSNQSNLSGNGGKKSIIVARVEQSDSGTLVDIEKIRKNLAANGVGVISGMDGMHPNGDHDSKTETSKTHITNITNIQNEEVTIYKAENKMLLWMIIILGLLLILAMLTVILCCICPGCPFYMEPRKRRVHSSETLIVQTDGKPQKHVQRTHLKTVNGFWSDTKQAWSADHDRKNWQFNKRNLAVDHGQKSLPDDIPNVVDPNIPPTLRNITPVAMHNETVHVHTEQEGVRRRADDKIFVEDIETQMENRTYDMDSIRRHEFERGSDVVQHFYRDGNAEVLRLVSRDHLEEETRRTEQSHGYNGKDILLQRFIEDQKLRKEQQDIEMNAQNRREVMQPEIILIPGSLDQKHLESLKSDIQQLIIDKNDYETRRQNYSKLRQQVESSVPNIEVTRVSDKFGGSSERIMQPYTLHDIELVRQNTLLTRLLLEREAKVIGGHTTDATSYLETQSLPGQVAIATQTDRTTATQTDCRLRSRSDNESEDETKLKKKFKFKKRYIEEEYPHRVKSMWMKSPERGRAYFGIRMDARRKMAEISDGKKTISPAVLREISESLNGRDHFSSNIDEDDEDERLLHYYRNPIKATKIEVCKETIEISTSSQEEMEHRILKMAHHKNIPIEPSFRVLEGEPSPRKKMRKVDDKRVQMASESAQEKIKDLKKMESQKRKIIKGTRELKVKEIKSTVDTTISRILGHSKKSKVSIKPIESESKVRKPLKHQAAIKADSGSSEIEDMYEKQQIGTPYNLPKKSKPVNSLEDPPSLKKVATYTDLSKTDLKTSPQKSSRLPLRTSPVKTSPSRKSYLTKVAPISDSKSIDLQRQASPSKKKSTVGKMKSTEQLQLSSKSDKALSELDPIKHKKKVHKDDSTKSLNVESVTIKATKPNVKENNTEPRHQVSVFTENSSQHVITKVKSVPKNMGKVDTSAATKSIINKDDSHQESKISVSKVQKIDEEKIITEKNNSREENQRSEDQKKITEPSFGETEKSNTKIKEEDNTENDTISYKEISYVRIGDNDSQDYDDRKNSNGDNYYFEETSKNEREPSKEKEMEEIQIDENVEKVKEEIASPVKAVFQKQKRVIEESEEAEEREIKSPVKLKKQFTDDFTQALAKMETSAIDAKKKQDGEDKNTSTPGDKKQLEEERKEVLSISETIFDKESTDEQTLKTNAVSEVPGPKADQASDLCDAVGEDGNQLLGQEKLEEFGENSPKVEKFDKTESDSITVMTKENLHINYDSESSDESDLSCKTMLNRNSLERRKLEKQTAVTESRESIENTISENKSNNSVTKSEAKKIEIAATKSETSSTARETVEHGTKDDEVEQFVEDKHRPINVLEKKVYSTEKPSKTIRSVQDVAESNEKETKSVVAKNLATEKEQQKSKSQIETCEQSKKDKLSRREDDKNPSRSSRVEKKKKPNVTDPDVEKKTERSPGRTKGPETRSRYMAWYTQKKEEMERKREERRLVEEEERPKWARKTKITKSDAETPETTPQSRRKVKPLINVESEQLKAIVRQGRRLRRGRVEDPSVQIFAPERTPPASSETTTPRHHLVQHSEYKFEREPPPFYLHPPPAPHPSPEHFPDCPMRECTHEDDIDSGIAVSLTGTTKLRHQQLLEKKSVFDIAYSEASPTKLCSDSSTPPPS